jgi:hypothetical protein
MGKPSLFAAACDALLLACAKTSQWISGSALMPYKT